MADTDRSTRAVPRPQPQPTEPAPVGAPSVSMVLRLMAHRGVARGPQPQATESAPVGAPSLPSYLL